MNSGSTNKELNEKVMQLYNEKYIEFLVNNYNIDKERLIKSLDYENATIEEQHYDLRENIDRITIAENWQITANLEELMDYCFMDLTIGKEKRFKLTIHDFSIEVNNLKEMIDVSFPIIQKQVFEDTVSTLKKYGKIPKNEFIDITKTSIKDLFDLVKDDSWFLMNHDMADAFLLSYYKEYSLLSDDDYMNRIVDHMKDLEEQKKIGHFVSDYFMSY